jgi:hypothetical protein
MPNKREFERKGQYSKTIKKDGVTVGAEKPGEEGTGYYWGGGQQESKALMNLVGQQSMPVGYLNKAGSQYEPLAMQYGAPYYPHTAVEMDPRYGDASAKLQEILGGKGYEQDLAAKQYEALVGASPQQAVTGAVGAVGSRAGGQIAEARKMSDIQMIQGLAGAKVEARKAQQQAVLAASGELRNIMQQQFMAWATTEGLSGDAFDRTQNQATMLQNTLLAELEAAINAGMVKTPEDFAKWGEYANKRWNDWNSASPEDKNAIAMQMGFTTAEPEPPPVKKPPGESGSAYVVPPDPNNAYEGYTDKQIIDSGQMCEGGVPCDGATLMHMGVEWTWDGEKWVKAVPVA